MEASGFEPSVCVLFIILCVGTLVRDDDETRQGKRTLTITSSHTDADSNCL